MGLARRGLVGLLATLAMISQSGVHAAAGTADSGNIVYTANPPRTLAVSTTDPSKFPSPSQCVKQFGLACYTPALIRSAYNVPANFTGDGQTIVIVDAFGSPTIRQDLHIFDLAFGLPDPTLNIIEPGGSPTFNPNSANQISWAFETTLDVEWSHAIAPAATIDLVVASSNFGNVLNNAEQYAVSNHLGNVISMSFGAPEGLIAGAGNNLQLQQAHAIYEQAKAAGITVFASSGDSGATNGLSSVNALYPASDPLVTAVGGTNLFLTNSGAYKSETVWNDSNPSLCPFTCRYGPFGATGGAPSSIFPAPEYQADVNGNAMRTTSDVAYNASVYTAVLAYVGFFSNPANNGFYFFGGTSEGAPQWAAIVALADESSGRALGFLNPKLYSILKSTEYGNDFHDVTVGDNGFFGPGFSARIGYDLPTGLGSPDVAHLLVTLSS
jgi:subtilase family serine protease